MVLDFKVLRVEGKFKKLNLAVNVERTLWITFKSYPQPETTPLPATINNNRYAAFTNNTCYFISTLPSPGWRLNNRCYSIVLTLHPTTTLDNACYL